jgi:uncharacterized surface protein with fasciclin (FAS1) repeats
MFYQDQNCTIVQPMRFKAGQLVVFQQTCTSLNIADYTFVGRTDVKYNNISDYKPVPIMLKGYPASYEVSKCKGVFGTRSPDAVVYPQFNITEAPDMQKDCLFTDWSEWSRCEQAEQVREDATGAIIWQATGKPATCGKALRYRTRELLQGKPFCTYTYMDEDCSLPACKPTEAPTNRFQECLLSEWQQWGKCSKTCGGGQSRRQRIIIQMPSPGLQCPANNDDIRACNRFPCEADIMGFISDPGRLQAGCGDRVSLMWLNSVLRGAGLAPQLRGVGPFMLFAPTDAAIRKFGASAILEKHLVDVLKYHVVVGSSINSLVSTALVNEREYTTMLARAIVPHIRPAMLFERMPPFSINQAIVVCRDNKVTNGVVHVIDELLIPPELRNVYQVMAASERPAPFRSFLSLIKQVGLETPLQSTEQGYTLLAPTEGAIGMLRQLYDQSSPAAELPTWLGLMVNKTASTIGELDILRTVLAYHIVPGKYWIGGSLASRRRQEQMNRFIPPLQTSQILGESVLFGSAAWNGNTTYAVMEAGNIPIIMSVTPRVGPDFVLANAAQVHGFDLIGTNGIVHMIGSVLVPPELRSIWFGLTSNARWRLYSEALQQFGLHFELNDLNANYTVLAPDDNSYRFLKERFIDANINSGRWGQPQMSKLLKSFWVHKTPCDLADGCGMSTLSAAKAQLEMTSGQSVLINPVQTGLYVGGWRVVEPKDVPCLNGIIHTLALETGPPSSSDIGSASPMTCKPDFLSWAIGTAVLLVLKY